MGSGVSTNAVQVQTGTMEKTMADATTMDGLKDLAGNNLQLAVGDTITASYSVNGTAHSTTYTITTDLTAKLSDVTDAIIAGDTTNLDTISPFKSFFVLNSVWSEILLISSPN